MALLTSAVPVAAGTVESLTAAAGGGDTYANSGKQMLVVNNGSGSSITVTWTAQHACEQGVLHDKTATVAAGARKTFPPVDQAHFNDDNGLVHVGYSLATSITVGVVSPT